MKDFIMKVDEDLDFKFSDDRDKATFKSLLSLLKSKNINKYRLTIEVISTKISEKQISLFRVIVDKVSQETGQDTSTISSTLLSNFSTKNRIEDFSNEDFQNFIESATAFINEFFGLILNFNDSGYVTISR